MSNAAKNPLNPPVAQEAVLVENSFSTAWYQWLASTVAKILNSPAGATAPPATATAAGTPGQIAYDQNFFYVCVGVNLWKRAALNTF